MNRREFLAGAVASAGLAGCVGDKCACAGGACGKGGKILFGACRPFADAKLMKSIGYDFIERDVGSSFIPEEGDEAWKKQKEMILSQALPLRSCNGFLPGKFRITGAEANWDPILKYAETACRRASEVGTKTIVFGSGGARNVPAVWLAGGKREWPKGFGIEKGRDQYAGFCAELVKRIEGCSVTVVIEPLCPDESNIINYVWQGMQIVDEVKSPRLQQLADLYHMMAGLEPAESLLKAGSPLRHCHIASYKTRQFPGSDPATVDRFRPYFDALKAIGYDGGVSCECAWGDKNDLAKNLETALKTMKGLV